MSRRATVLTVPSWSGRKVTEARALVGTWLPTPCGQCGKRVNPGDDFVVGHIIARWERPDLTWDVSNWAPEHKACSDKTGQSEVIRKARAAGARDALNGVNFSHESTPRKSPLLPAHTYSASSDQFEIPDRLTWANFVRTAPDWAKPILDIPGDAGEPLAINPIHPDSVGSYGFQAIEWVRTELDIDLRWWQQLAFIRQLEHDADGRLVWKTVLETCPRRAGKSVRLRSMALWRIAHPHLFRESQLVLHCGRDLSIAREIHRRAWSWAAARRWVVRRGVGQEEIAAPGEFEESRWLVRSLDSIYGFDVGLAMVDEAWDVEPVVVEEGLEPATLERESPQVHLTSTAHRRATKLMPGRLAGALASDDGETLVLWWGAAPSADVSNPLTWRAASPHWSDSRARMVAAKYDAAVNGDPDPEFGDVDPMESFETQYLNRWSLKPRPKAVRGDSIATADAWRDLTAGRPGRTPDAAAIEGWFGDGVSLALAWRSDVGAPVVALTEFGDLAQAVAALRETGYRGRVDVGASLATDPALSGIRVNAMTTRTAPAVVDVARMVSERGLRHDGGQHLTDQVLNVRTQPGGDGPRLVSKSRADGIKATSWAIQAVRSRVRKNPRFLVPSI